MDYTIKKANQFIGFEYKDKTIKKAYVSLYTDSYENFGWELDSMSNNLQSPNTVNMKFKRDRKIRNKAELTRLQRQFDSLVEQIDALERSKNSFATAMALLIGIIGTAFMAGSVFAISYGENIPLMIVLAVPAFMGWAAPYFVYEHIRKNKTKTIEPLIDEKYEEIYEVTKRANSLLG